MRLTLRSRTSAVALSAFALLVGIVAHPDLREARGSQAHPPFGLLASTNAPLGTVVGGIEDGEVEIVPLRTRFLHNQDDLPRTRWVKVTAVLRVQTSIGGSTANAYIDIVQDNCTSCTLYRIAGSNAYLPGTGGAGSETMVVTGHIWLTWGVWYAKVYVKRSFGPGTIAVSQTSGTPMSVMVQDIGP